MTNILERILLKDSTKIGILYNNKILNDDVLLNNNIIKDILLIESLNKKKIYAILEYYKNNNIIPFQIINQENINLINEDNKLFLIQNNNDKYEINIFDKYIIRIIEYIENLELIYNDIKKGYTYNEILKKIMNKFNINISSENCNEIFLNDCVETYNIKNDIDNLLYFYFNFINEINENIKDLCNYYMKIYFYDKTKLDNLEEKIINKINNFYNYSVNEKFRIHNYNTTIVDYYNNIIKFINKKSSFPNKFYSFITLLLLIYLSYNIYLFIENEDIMTKINIFIGSIILIISIITYYSKYWIGNYINFYEKYKDNFIEIYNKKLNFNNTLNINNENIRINYNSFNSGLNDININSYKSNLNFCCCSYDSCIGNNIIKLYNGDYYAANNLKNILLGINKTYFQKFKKYIVLEHKINNLDELKAIIQRLKVQQLFYVIEIKNNNIYIIIIQNYYEKIYKDDNKILSFINNIIDNKIMLGKNVYYSFLFEYKNLYMNYYDSIV